jgi:uncharacterized OsmC-like protein
METGEEVRGAQVSARLRAGFVRGNPCLLTDAAIAEIAFEAQVSEEQAWAVLHTASKRFCPLERLLLDRSAELAAHVDRPLVAA